MSYPRQKDKFDAWHKAMVAGATVDKPNYGKTKKTQQARKQRHHRRKRVTSRRKNAKE